ncbi:MAG: DUF1295 domain-containing protein [Syntrophobacteraceae bacterium]|nr:DUF1295 domain-containing protein [Syntrophobacteraceae bacterium]
MDSTLSILASNLLLVLALMSALWVASLLKKDAGVADIFWGIGFIVVAWATFYATEGAILRSSLIVVLTTVWGIRLAAHIGVRNLGKPEDRRYQGWRAKYGRSFWWVSLFQVFLLQGVLLWVISLVLQAGQLSSIPNGLTWLDVLGTLVWLAGFLFEAIADWQLASFRSDPANTGKVMDRGLWAATRHPNYFGECLLWWGFFLITLSTPYGFLTIISPLTITFLLLKVSGVTLLETSIVETRPQYREYMERTSAFIPRFTRKEKL